MPEGIVRQERAKSHESTVTEERYE
jgi:hypothetical protein